MRTILLTIIIAAAGCAVTPEASYTVYDNRAAWLEQFQSDKAACESRGGRIVSERRIGRRNRAPLPGTRYYCQVGI